MAEGGAEITDVQLDVYEFPDNALCQYCVDGEDAIAFCKDCDRLLGEECLDYHKKQVDTQHHTIKDSPNAEILKKKTYCDKHTDKSLDYFCKKCDQPVCQHCSLQTCRDHKMLVSTDIREEMTKLIDSVKENKESFCQHKEFIESVLAQNGDALYQCEGEINRAFDSMIAELQSQREATLAQLKENTEMNSRKVEVQKQIVEGTIREMDQTIQSADNLLKTKKDSKLMVNKVKMNSDLTERAEYAWDRASATFRSWQLDHKSQKVHSVQFSKLIPKPRMPDIIVEGISNEAEAHVGVPNVFKITANLKDQLDMYDDSTKNAFLSVDILFKRGNKGTGTTISRTIERESNVWTVRYLLRQHGTVTISLAMFGVKLESSPFALSTNESTKELKVNDQVERGPDWKWDNQDGGLGNKGTVIDVTRKGWVNVKWNGIRKPLDYRWGAHESFDLKLVN